MLTISRTMTGLTTVMMMTMTATAMAMIVTMTWIFYHSYFSSKTSLGEEVVDKEVQDLPSDSDEQ